ncbi:MAG: sigma-54 dependent transcriptional regulator [Chitinivorax sp.]
MKPLPILVVEDDASLREALQDTLELAGYQVIAAGDGDAALARLKSNRIGLIISDVQMQPMDGYTLLKRAKQQVPHVPFLLMTAFGELQKAVEAMRNGAAHYLLKPFEPDVLLAEVAKYLIPGEDVTADEWVAEDPATQAVMALAQRVAATDATVLLAGESGVGKEVFARYIHRHSARAKGPFVAINCAAIPEQLLESTLFGHEKGAFTGASQAQAGKFEQAENGTLLLDEISEMPLLLQAKLLRVLQEREVERVGGQKPVKVNIRVLATTNRDMAAEVAAGRFREDLYYRLNVFPLNIPALRQRRGDILPLARKVLQRFAEQMGRPALRFSGEAEAALLAHGWDGNVRELENVVQRAAILAMTDVIEPSQLLLPTPSGPVVAVAANASTASTAELPMDMESIERRTILETLEQVNGSRKLAAERLGISERTLRYKLKQYREEAGE